MTELRNQHLHFDCASGAAGDMTVAALIDCGVPQSVVAEAVAAVGLDPGRLSIKRIVKSGIAAVDFRVVVDDLVAEKGERDHHSHHHYDEIRTRVEGANLSPDVVKRALEIFDRLARAEAKLHGTTVEKVAFHEVGAIDSLADIVGAAAALSWLSPAQVSSSPVAMGHGHIECAHGRLPVPSPAALEIMRSAGALVADGDAETELCTPTGAAILASIVTSWGPMPSLVPVAVGYGAGDVDLEDRPNVLRAVLGSAQAGSTGMVRVEANIDDMSPELCEHVAEELFAAGAADVWWTPITMKKTRPAVQLSVLTGAASLDAAISVILTETTTIGVRFDEVSRQTLQRESVEVETRFGPIPIKVARLRGQIVNVAPEYEACRAAAKQHGVPLKRVFAAALAAHTGTS